MGGDGCESVGMGGNVRGRAVIAGEGGIVVLYNCGLSGYIYI